jgi:hypothetical protein
MAPDLHIPTVMNRRISAILPCLSRACVGGVLMLAVSSVPAFAQGRPRPIKPIIAVPKGKVTVPPGFAPPTGMCRIWIEGVPAEQQPAPTDCASAVKNRPLNGKVIFSEEKPAAPTPKKKSEEVSSL